LNGKLKKTNYFGNSFFSFFFNTDWHVSHSLCGEKNSARCERCFSHSHLQGKKSEK
jgi:hypothetical protein